MVRRCVAILLLLYANGTVYSQSLPQTHLTVRTEPSGATVTLDGIELGITPLIAQLVDPGRRRLQVELDGYQISEEFLFLTIGTETVREIPLRVPTGTVIFTFPSHIDPAQVEISIADSLYQPGAISLPVGRYRAIFRASGFAEEPVTVTIREEQETLIAVAPRPAIPQIDSLRISPRRLSPGSLPPFDTAVISFNTGSLGHYEIEIVAPDGTVSHLSGRSSKRRNSVLWKIPEAAQQGIYTLNLRFTDQSGWSSDSLSFHIHEAALVRPRALTSRGSGTSLVHLPGNTAGLYSFAVGTGLAGANARLMLPISTVASIPIRSIGHITGAILADISLDGEAQRIFFGGTAAFSAYRGSLGNGTFALDTRIGGIGGFGESQSALIDASTSISWELAKRRFGIAVEPVIAMGLADPNHPTAIIGGGTALYFQTTRLFTAASASVSYTIGGVLSFAVAGDLVIRIGNLPTFLSLGVLAEDLTMRGRLAVSFIQ